MIAKPVLLAILAWAGLPLFGDQFSIPARGWIEVPKSASGASTDELNKYQCYTRKVLWTIWDREIMKNQTSLWFGEVKIHCTIHSDGTLSDPSIVVGESTGLLKTVSMDSLMASAPFKPFNDALVKEVGNSYVDNFIFTVAQKPHRQDKDWAPGGEDHPASSSPLD